MGQRHQYLIVYPEKQLGSNNQNNKPSQAEVIHHQWLYGRSAIFSLKRVLTLIKETTVDGPDYLFGTQSNGYRNGDGTKAIAAAISVWPEEGYYHNVHIWEEPCEPSDLEPDHFDNNDGITLIQFEAGNKVPKVCFITPSHLEGAHYRPTSDGHGPWSASEYLGFYYDEKDMAEFTDEVQENLKKAMEYIESNSRPFTKKEVKALLPLFKF